ncbi:hypothetical protein VTJ04DRAFT_7238 [Mycothermus thermophilus]|uniref:uncharacterized protein n=1 Tax=Humicola insolens TaxID=85995 RepID=UPI00374486DF
MPSLSYSDALKGLRTKTPARTASTLNIEGAGERGNKEGVSDTGSNGSTDTEFLMYVGGLDFGAFERHLEAESPNPNDPEDFPDIPIVPLGHPEVLDAFYKQLAARAMINGPGNGCDAVEAGENRHDNSPAHDESVHEPGTNETEHEQVFDCFFCENRQFNTAEEREEHEGFSHNYCRRCDRFFLDSSKYETHRNSPAHRDPTVPCPFCGTAFTTTAGICHHLESSTCPERPNFNDDTMYQMIRAKDTESIITNPRTKRVTGPTKVGEETRKGRYYRCPVGCDKPFKSLEALQGHMNSSVHRENLYKCPGLFCAAQFKKFSAVVNHLESGACHYMTPGQVRRWVKDILVTNRRVFRLRGKRADHKR